MTTPPPDLKQRLTNDHQKLDRLFDSLASSLTELQDSQVAPEGQEVLEDIREDLSFILEEMFEHFGIEEEAIFQHISDTLPSLQKRLDRLEADHEFLSSSTARLRKMVAAAGAGLRELDLALSQELITNMRQTLKEHNQRELSIFLQALDKMNPTDRDVLLENLRQL
jgi:hemerythrin-like domain-containing protein